MADLDAGDSFLTSYDPDARLLDKLQKLAQTSGLCVWLSDS